MKTKKQYKSLIKIPDNVIVEKKNNILYFQGPLGKTLLNLRLIDPKGLAGIFISTTHNLKNNEKHNLQITTTSKAFYGLLKTIIQNKLHGVSRGFLMYLKIYGIGYRAKLIQKSSSSFLINDQKTSTDNSLSTNKSQKSFSHYLNTKNSIQTLFLKLGYSHDIVYNIPYSIRVFLVDPTLICLFGVDKNQVTQIAAQIRNLRSPSVYKGKGIRLLNEKIKLKVGKRK